MTHTETHNTAARVAAPGAPAAPAQASTKNGASQKMGAPQRPKTAAEGKIKGRAEKKSKAKGESRRRRRTARREQGRPDPGVDPAVEGLLWPRLLSSPSFEKLMADISVHIRRKDVCTLGTLICRCHTSYGLDIVPVDTQQPFHDELVVNKTGRHIVPTKTTVSFQSRQFIVIQRLPRRQTPPHILDFCRLQAGVLNSTLAGEEQSF
jgi:hypothetical protein